jgi:sugar/nucleoside kinase (ribokinase family)
LQKTFDVLSVGELNPDFIMAHIKADAPRLGVEQEATDFRMSLGSSTAICTVGLSRLGLATAMVAKVGKDAYGAFCIKALEREGVVTSAILLSATETTGVTVSFTYATDRLLVTYPGTMVSLSASDVPDDLLSKARHLHVSSFFLQKALRAGCADLFAKAKAFGLTTSLDTGWDPLETWLSDDLARVLPYLDVFLPNQQEALALSEEETVAPAAQSFLEHGIHTVVVKRGNEGAYLMRRDGLTLEHPGYPISVVDTTGAGDSFNAGFLYGFLKRLPFETCLKLANACGALAATAVGGTEGFKTLVEVHQFLASRENPPLP